MATSTYSLVIPGFNKADIAELRGLLPKGALVEEPEATSGRRHGDLVTIAAVVTLGNVVVGSLIAWLAAARRKNIKERKWRIRQPDGTEIDVHFKDVDSDQKALDPEVAKAVLAAGVKPEDFLKLAGSK